LGFLEDAFDVIKGGVDAVGNAVDAVEDGARKFLPEAKNFLQRFEELGGVTKGPSLLDKAGFMMDNPLVKLAGSPILAAAQLAINGMKLTTGWDEPENGDQFGQSASDMWDAGLSLLYADPIPGNWDGSASEKYAGTNSEHRHQIFEVSYADKEIQGILSEEATQVAGARQTLTGYSDFLADFDTATSWLSFVPGGGAVKAAMDMAVASANVAAAEATIGKLIWDVSDNASKIEAATRRYQTARDQELDQEVLHSGSCRPFGEEWLEGNRPPTRTQTDKYIPRPQGPPVVQYPPATPFGSPTPASSPVTTPGTSTPTPISTSPAPSAPAPAVSMPGPPAAVAPAPPTPASAAPAAGAPSSASPAVARAATPAQPNAPIRPGTQPGSSDNRRAPIAPAVDVDPPQSSASPDAATSRQ
jgi:ESX secretion-associated protein EspA/E